MAGSSILLDASNTASCVGVSTVSIPLTVGSGTGRYLVVAVYYTYSTGNASGITYNDVALTKIQTATTTYTFGEQNYTQTLEIWTLVAPTTGSSNVVIDFSGTVNACILSNSWTGVLQTNSIVESNIQIQQQIQSTIVPVVSGPLNPIIYDQGTLGLNFCGFVPLGTSEETFFLPPSGMVGVVLSGNTDNGTLAEATGSLTPRYLSQASWQFFLRESCITAYIRLNPIVCYLSINSQGDSDLVANTKVPAFVHLTGSSQLVATASVVSFQVQFFDYISGTLLADTGPTSGGDVIALPVAPDYPQVEATLTYTGDVSPNVAVLDVRWPSSYTIFWSTGEINYSNPQDVVMDIGVSSFTYVTDTLISGSWNWNVLSVDDEGNQQESPLSQTPEVVNIPPAPPVIVSVTQGGVGVGIVTYFVELTSVDGSLNTIYFSDINRPINYGLLPGPTPYVCGGYGPNLGEIYVLFPDTIPEDLTSAYNTLVTTWDAAVAECSSTEFSCQAFITLGTAVATALNAFQVSSNQPLLQKRTTLSSAFHTAYTNIYNTLSNGIDYTPYYNKFLQTLGDLLCGDPSRYTTSSISGSSPSIYDICQPFIKPSYVGIVVRSTLNGVQDQNVNTYLLQVDNSGNIISDVPAPAVLKSYVLTDTTITVKASIQDNNTAPATICDLYVIPASSYPTETIDLTSPTQSQNFLVGFMPTIKNVTFTPVTVTPGTWYIVSVVGRTSDGIRSSSYNTRLVYIATDTPVAPSAVEAEVVNG